MAVVKKVNLKFQISDEDIAAARAVGATGTQVVERSIHSQLDKAGVPREGRYVKVTTEEIQIELPDGWEPAFES